MRKDKAPVKISICSQPNPPGTRKELEWNAHKSSAHLDMVDLATLSTIM